MKLTVAPPLLFMLLSPAGLVGADHLRGARKLGADLEPGKNYVWVVSKGFEEDWCLSANRGASYFEPLGFEKCQFGDSIGSVSAAQLWHWEPYGMGYQLRSGLNFDQCMVVGYGRVAFTGVTARMQECNRVEDFKAFNYRDDHTIQWTTPQADLCLTNEGNNADNTDTMHFKTCTDAGRFQMELKTFPDDEDNGYINLSSVHYSGCIGVDRRSAAIDSKLEIMECDSSSDRQLFRFENGMIRVKAGGGENCLQAGLDGPVNNGEYIRVSLCDPENELQKIDWRDTQRGQVLGVGNDYCVVNQGSTFDLGDTLKVIECNSVEPKDRLYYR
jgi:hypothetical protein